MSINPIFMDDDDSGDAVVIAMPGRTPCPEPGVYPGVEFETYLAWDAENHTTLRHMDTSPAHYLAARKANTSKETKSKSFGTAEHTLLFEPDRFQKLLLPPPMHTRKDDDGNPYATPYGRNTKAWAKYAAKNPGRIILTNEDVARLRGSIDAIKACEDAWTYLSCAGRSEVAVVWDQKTARGMVRCKCRIDRLVDDTELRKHYGWVDLKTTQLAAPVVWRGHMTKYGYNTQDAMIDLACAALKLPPNGLFVAVETGEKTNEHHGVGVYPIGEETKKASKAVVLGWLDRVAECRAKNDWPGYGRLQTIDAPEWWFKQRFGDGFDSDD